MSNDYGKTDIQLMSQNATKILTLGWQKQEREVQARETEYLNSELERYSAKNINKVKNSGLLADLTTFGSIVKINSFKSILDSFDLQQEEKIVMFDNMLSELNNTKNDNFIYLRVENAKGFLFFEVFPRIKNKSVKIKF